LDWVRIYFNAFGVSLVRTFFYGVRRIDMAIKTSLLILSLSSICLLVPAVQAKAVVEQQNHKQTVTLDIQNMACDLCTITIKKALHKVGGVQQVTVDYDSKTAVVIFDPQKTSNDALVKATTDAGYPANVRPIHQ
jgi:periplasmic mercuric ion binding protein